MTTFNATHQTTTMVTAFTTAHQTTTTMTNEYDEYKLDNDFDYKDNEPADDDILDKKKEINLKKLLPVGEITQMLVEEQISIY